MQNQGSILSFHGLARLALGWAFNLIRPATSILGWIRQHINFRLLPTFSHRRRFFALLPLLWGLAIFGQGNLWAQGAYDGQYSGVFNSIIQGVSNSGTEPFSVTNGAVNISNVFVGTVDANGNFVGTWDLLGNGSPLAMSGRFSLTNSFMLSGSRTNVSGTVVATYLGNLVIQTQPANQTADIGATVTFNVTATGGTGTLTYQWFKNGTAIGGATGASLVLTNVQQGDAADYTVKVSDSAGKNVTSDAATLTVGSKTTAITANPLQCLILNQLHREESCRGDPVDTGTGAQNFYRTLISISGMRGIDFTVNYNSVTVSLGLATDMGNGWSHPYLAQAAEETDKSGNPVIVVAWSGAHVDLYSSTASASGTTYAGLTEANQYDVLTKPSSTKFALVKPDGTTYSFVYSATSSTYNLTQIANRFGQTLTINSSADDTQLVSIVEPVSGATMNFTYTGTNITKITDSASRSVVLAYDGTGMLSQITDVNGNKTTYAYDTSNRLTSVTAADGSVIYRNMYDSLGRVASQYDGVTANKALLFAYDETSQPGKVVTTVTDRTGVKTVFVHDSLYHLLSVTDPMGHAINYTYDSKGNRTAITDALGHSITFTYSANGNVLTSTDSAGGTTAFTYDAFNNPLSVTNPAGKTATFTYDANNNPLTLVDILGNKTTRNYDANSELTSVTSPNGNLTKYSYTKGLLTTITDPLSNTSSLGYDAAGRLTSVQDPAGGIVSYTHEASGKLLSKTDAIGNKTAYSYDVRDRIVSVTDPLKGTTGYTYDANSNLVSLIDALGQTTTYAYDIENRLITITDPLSHTTSYSYDSAGRLTATSDALGNSVKFAYDAVGNRTAVYDALGNTVLQTSYDTRNLPVKITDALANSTVQTYDVLARVTQRTDPLGLKTTFSYDDLGRLTSATDPANQISLQAFDPDGNRSSLNDPGANGLIFSYDKANHLTATTSTGGRATSYTYDARGLTTGLTYPSGSKVTVTYDAAGRLTKWVDAFSEIDYNYDAKGRLTSVKEGSKTISRVCDALDRVVSFTDSAGNIIQYAYDAAGNLTTLTYPDGKKVSYTYDAANRLTSVTDWASRVTQYGYDANGRLTTTTRPNASKQTRSYDKAGQLAGLADKAADGTVIVQYACTYDADGRLTGVTRSPAVPSFTPSPAQFIYGNDNRLTSVSGQSVAHDANGNLLAAPLGSALATLAYDARNRLTSAGILSYGYDAENRRILSSDVTGNTTYVIDPIARLSRLLVAVAPSGSTIRYVYGLGALYQETDGVTVRYLHEDPRGNTVALSGSTGTVIGRIEYGPFGEVSSQIGDTATTLLYSGKFGVETDANGLLNMRARYYNPQLKRFLQPDVLSGQIDLAGTLNRYAYAANDPINLSDPVGFSPYDVTTSDSTSSGTIPALTHAPDVPWVGVTGPITVPAPGYGIVPTGYQWSNTAPGDPATFIAVMQPIAAAAFPPLEIPFALLTVGQVILSDTPKTDSAIALLSWLPNEKVKIIATALDITKNILATPGFAFSASQRSSKLEQSATDCGRSAETYPQMKEWPSNSGGNGQNFNPNNPVVLTLAPKY